MAKRVRLDERVVELGLELTRSKAQLRIRAGDVLLADRVVDQPGTRIPADAVPVLRVRARYVSRGGEKLAGALDALRIDPSGLGCIDVGASTGGFTDCLLQRGAAAVLALDVGYGQLDGRLREDPRVSILERTNVRHFCLEPGAARFDLLTADLAFISLRLVLSRLRDLVREEGRLLLLVKPQFELEAREVGSGGVVRDPSMRAAALERVRAAAEDLGLHPLGQTESVLPGPKGNREQFLLLLRTREGGCGEVSLRPQGPYTMDRN